MGLVVTSESECWTRGIRWLTMTAEGARRAPSGRSVLPIIDSLGPSTLHSPLDNLLGGAAARLALMWWLSMIRR